MRFSDRAYFLIVNVGSLQFGGVDPPDRESTVLSCTSSGGYGSSKSLPLPGEGWWSERLFAMTLWSDNVSLFRATTRWLNVVTKFTNHITSSCSLHVLFAPQDTQSCVWLDIHPRSSSDIPPSHCGSTLAKTTAL